LIIFPKDVYANNEIKIGLLAPFSGEFEDIGKSVFSSARMALNKINNENINILPRDTKGKNIYILIINLV
jgi:ABC-type branched-subunit amino acid transport system substrate-binding protein